MGRHVLLAAFLCVLIFPSESQGEEAPAETAPTEVAPPSPTPAPTPPPEPKVEKSEEKPKGGIYLGTSAIYRPKIVSELGSQVNFRGELGLRLSPYSFIGLKVSNDNISSLSLGDGTLVLKPMHWLVGISVHGEYPLTAPDFLWGRVQFLLPAGVITYMNIITARGTPFTNVVLDLYGGGGTRVGLGGDFFIDVAAVYHFGIPIMKLESTPGTPLKNSSGQEVNGSTTGFELRTGLSILF